MPDLKMADLKAQLETALKNAAEYQLLACLASDPRKREECSTRAQFQYNIAGALKTRIAMERATQEPAELQTRPGVRKAAEVNQRPVNGT